MPLLSVGFRPFFLLGGAFAALVVPAWLLVLQGSLALHGPLVGARWHAHEMIHGFAAAILAGFLLTAVRSWTGRETASGPALGALAALWVAGRVASAAVPGWVSSAIDLAFLPAVALVIARPLWAGGQARNAVFPAILLAMAGANLAVHLDAHGVAPGVGRTADRLAVHLVALAVVVVAGRVVPMFTRNATKITEIAGDLRLDRAAVALAAAVAVLPLVPAPLAVRVALPVAAGCVVAARTYGWGARFTASQPLLWVLHVGHGLVAVGLVAEGLAALHPARETLALHVLTVGGIGVTTLGMMARVALGHTGRPLVVRWPVAAAFALVIAATCVRALGPLWDPAHTVAWWWVAGAGWAAAFAIYVAAYVRILTAPRVTA